MPLSSQKSERLGQFSPLLDERKLRLLDQAIAEREGREAPVRGIEERQEPVQRKLSDRQLELLDQAIAERERVEAPVEKPSWGETITRPLAAGLAGVNIALARGARDVVKLADYPTRAVRDVFGIKTREPGVEFLERYTAGEQKRRAEIDISQELSELPWHHPKRIIGTGLQAIPQVATVVGTALMAPPVAAKAVAATTLGIIAYGPAAEEAKAEGASEVQQVLHGLTSAQIEVITELPVLGAVGKLWTYLKKGGVGKKAGVDFITRLLKGVGLFGKGMAFETVQEMEAYLGGQMSKRLHYDPDAPITMEALKEAGYGGATMSAVLFGVGAPGMAARLAAVKPKITDAEFNKAKADVLDTVVTTLKEGEQTPEQALESLRAGYENELFDVSDLGEVAEQAPGLRSGIDEILARDVESREAEQQEAYRRTPEGRQELIEAEMPERVEAPMTTISEETTALVEAETKPIPEEIVEPLPEVPAPMRALGMRRVEPAPAELPAEVAREPAGVELSPEIQDKVIQGKDWGDSYMFTDKKTESSFMIKKDVPDINEAVSEKLKEIEEKYKAVEKPVKEAAAEKVEVVKPIQELSLDQFEEAGHNAWEITQSQWVKMQRAHRRSLGQPEESGTPYAPFADYEQFHKQEVTQAIKAGETISPEVLAEYPDLAPAKPPTAKPPEAKPPEAVTAEIKAEVIPEPTPKVEKEKVEVKIEKIAKRYGIEVFSKEKANAMIIRDREEIPTRLDYDNPNAEALQFMSKQEQENTFKEFSKTNEDTFKGFMGAFKNDIFDAKTGKPLEIGGDVIATKSIREKVEVVPEKVEVAEKPADVKARLLENIKSEKGESVLINDLSILGADAIRKGHESFKAFSERMRAILRDVWDKVKHLMRKAYDAAKIVVESERGEIVLKEPKVRKLTAAEKMLGLKKIAEKIKKPTVAEKIPVLKKKPTQMEEAFKILGIKPKLKPGEPLPKRARSVGLAYQEVSDEAKRLEVEMGLEYPKVTRTHADLREQADRIMSDQEQLLKTMIKEKNFTEAEGLVIRRSAVSGLDTLMKAVATENIEKANEMHKTFKEGIGHRLQDLHNEFGRNLESLKEKVGPESIAKAFANLERKLNKEDMDRFNTASEALGMGNAKPMINFLKFLKTTKADPVIMDYVYEYWYNSILSGIPTHVVNVASNTAWAAWQIGVHKPLLAAIDPLVAKFQKRPTEYYIDEIIPALAGVKKGLRPGLRGAKEVIVKGYTTNAEMDKFAIDMGKSVGAFARSPNKYLRMIAPFISFPTRTLRSMDIWAKQMNFQAELGSIAKRMEKQGKGKYEDILKNPTEAMMNQASEYADYTTFMDRLGTIGTRIEKLRGDVPGGRFIVPFVRTIANLVKRGVEMTPGVGALKLPYRYFLGEKVTGPEVSQILAKQIEGIMIATVVALMFIDDEITGDAPANKAEREAFYRQGKKPWAIKIGDRWYQYRRVEPFNTPIASVGILYDTWKRTGEAPSTEFAWRAAAGFVNNIIDSSYLSGLTQVLDSVRKADKWPQKLTNMFDRTIASFSPMSSFQRSFVRAIEALDKEGAILRKPKGALETVLAATPFVSKIVSARKDVWGEDVVIPGTPIEQWLPWKTAKVSEDVVEKEIERLHDAGLLSYPGMPAKYMSIKGKRIDLDNEQYDKIVVESGKAAKKKLNQLIGTRYWKMLSNKAKASRIQKIIRDSRKKSRNKLKRQLGGMVPSKRPDWRESVFGKKSAWQKSRFTETRF